MVGRVHPTRRGELSLAQQFGLAATPVDIEGDGDFDIVEQGLDT